VEFMGRSSTAAEQPTTVNINSWGTPEEGMYIDTMICSKPISMLVDTGASFTILSQKFLNTIDPSLKPEILPVNIKMKTATGEISSFLGHIAVELKLGKNLIKHKVLIANIPIEGILGMDFLEINNCNVLLSKSCIRYRGNEIPCFKYKNNGNATCCRIGIYEKIALPPSSETIVAGRAMDPIFKGMTGQLEPIEIDMIEECHNINAVNCNVQRETIQWPEHIKTIFYNNINESAENQKVSFKILFLSPQLILVGLK
jgi:hypothetical protein